MSRLLFLLLAGCAPLATVLDPPLAQLARWQDNPALAAAQPVVACADGHPACQQLHARRAEACMARAMAARAPRAACPGLSARGDLDCALDAYHAARRISANPALAAGHAQALICAGYLSANADHPRFGRAALEAAQAAGSTLLTTRAQALIDGAPR